MLFRDESNKLGRSNQIMFETNKSQLLTTNIIRNKKNNSILRPAQSAAYQDSTAIRIRFGLVEFKLTATCKRHLSELIINFIDEGYNRKRIPPLLTRWLCAALSLFDNIL